MQKKKQLMVIAAAMVTFSSLPANDMVFAQEIAVTQAASVVDVTGNHSISSEKILAAITASGDKSRINDTVYKLYYKAGYNFVLVDVFEENSKTTVFVNEMVVNNIAVEGNNKLSADEIKALIPALTVGKTPNVTLLSKQVQLANENPSYKIAIDFRPVGNGKINAVVKVKEGPSVRNMISVDNTGNEYTGDYRVNFSHIDSNVNNGQTLAVSMATSPNQTQDVKQFGLFYNIPLRNTGDNLYLTASYSDTNSGRVLDQGLYSIDASGKGNTVGLHYVRNLSLSKNNRQSLDIGIDQRNYDNDTLFTFTGMPINLGVDITTRPFSLSYQNSKRASDHNFSYGLTLVHNLPGGDKNSTEQFDSYRAGTNANYQIWRGNANYQKQLKNNWILNMALQGQYADERLIYPEQFGLGGARTIRGFNEREIAGDRGFVGNIELYSPEIAKGQRFVGFTDFGKQWSIDPSVGEFSKEAMASVGIGWRYYNKDVAINADYAVVVNGTTKTDDNSTKLHFSITKSL